MIGFSSGLGAFLALAGLFWAIDAPTWLNWFIYQEQFIAAALGGSLFIAFAGRAARHDGGQPSVLRVFAARFIPSSVGLAAGLWLCVRYPVLQADVIAHETEAIVLATVLLLLSLEACRRSAGSVLTIVFGVFFAWALFGYLLPGMFATKQVSLARLVPYLALDTSSMLGASLMIAATTVLVFMFFGRILQNCGGAEFFTDISTAMFGRYRGGTGKVEVVASALFGTISGSAVANVMSTGIITIPNMKKAGYTPQTAGAVEAVSSTGGQIMPPVMGAAAFLMAENLQVRYVEVALAALIPSLLFYVSIFVQVDLEAARRKIGGIDPAELPRSGDVFRRGWFFLIPFVVLFALMGTTDVQAEPAVLLGVLAMLPFAFWKGYGGKRLSLRGMLGALTATGRDAVDIIVICAVAGAVIGLLNISGLSLSLSLALAKLGEGNVILLLVAVAVMCLILGMGLPTTGVYLLVAVIAAPSLVQLGVQPLAAHMFVFFFGCLSMITPPVAMAAFAAAHIAQTSPVQVAMTACRLGWPAFVIPFVFVFSPGLLMGGGLVVIVVSLVAACAGVWMGSVALAGQLTRPLAVVSRWAAALSCALLLYPFEASLAGALIKIGGALLCVGLAVREFRAVPMSAAARTQAP
jgi:TRAP transporter 4TM/12TM fusion protein